MQSRTKMEKTRVGTIPVAFIAVTWNAESVISNTNQPRAIVDIKNDTTDAREANQNNRNATEEKALKGPSFLVGWPSTKDASLFSSLFSMNQHLPSTNKLYKLTVNIVTF